MIINIIVIGGNARIYSPFAAKDTVKALPGAHWDSGQRCWVIPAAYAQFAAGELRRHGYIVTVDNESQPRPQAPDNIRAGEPWEAMLLAVPSELRERAYKALSRVLHPDVGGDIAAMQGLTQAYAKVGGRR